MTVLSVWRRLFALEMERRLFRGLGPFGGDSRRPAFRLIATSTAAIRNVRLTTILAGRNTKIALKNFA